MKKIDFIAWQIKTKTWWSLRESSNITETPPAEGQTSFDLHRQRKRQQRFSHRRTKMKTTQLWRKEDLLKNDTTWLLAFELQTLKFSHKIYICLPSLLKFHTKTDIIALLSNVSTAETVWFQVGSEVTTSRWSRTIRRDKRGPGLLSYKNLK